MIGWYLNRLKHKLHRDRQLVAYGVGNLTPLVPGHGYLFFDVDFIDHDSIIESDAVHNMFKYWYKEKYVVLKTKHGVHFVSLVLEPLSDLYKKFQILKSEAYTDYYWDIPLFLRYSAKYDRKTGEVVSEAPYPISNPSGIDVMKFMLSLYPRKVYYTWD